MEVVETIQKSDIFDINMKALRVWKTHGKPSLDSAKEKYEIKGIETNDNNIPMFAHEHEIKKKQDGEIIDEDTRGIFTHKTVEKYVDEGR